MNSPYREQPDRPMTVDEAKEVLRLYRGWNDGQQSMTFAATRGAERTKEDDIYDARRALVLRATKLLSIAGERAQKEIELLLEFEKIFRRFWAADSDSVRHAMYEGHADGLDAFEGPEQIKRLEKATAEVSAKLAELDALREKAG